MAIPIPDLKHAAILSMDLHNSIISAYLPHGQEDFLGRVVMVQQAARSHGVPVIHVQVGFRPGLPEISGRNVLFAALKSSPQWQKMFLGDSGALHPAVAPSAHEIVVTKHRVSAFAGTDLEMILRAGDIDTLVLTGIATSGVVLSTLLHAADADFRLAVVSDCCADRDPELDACLKQRFFPARAAVAEAADIVNAIGAR